MVLLLKCVLKAPVYFALFWLTLIYVVWAEFENIEKRDCVISALFVLYEDITVDHSYICVDI